MKHLLTALLGMAAASMTDTEQKSLLKTLDDDKPKNQFPFSEEEKEFLAAIENKKERKAYIKKLKDKYSKLSRESNA